MTKKRKTGKAEVVPPAEATAPPEAPPPSQGEPSAPDVAGLQRELEEHRKRGEELLARLQYLQADAENQRKRAEREVEQATRSANEALVARLLPVLDDLDAAVATVPGEYGKGYAMLRENLWKALAEAGLQEVPTEGTPFDPYVHEAVQQVPDGSLPDGSIKDVVRRGYRFQMKVLRPAQVVVVNNGGEANA